MAIVNPPSFLSSAGAIGGDPAWPTLVNMCVIRPAYDKMQQAYEDYRRDRSPCKAGITNQCAVRMSVALERCGFSIGGFEPAARVHRNRPACRLAIPHVLGADELQRYLRRVMGRFEEFPRARVSTAQTSVTGRRGIIYFNNCFRRTPGGPSTGDHIDLWNGTAYYNMLLDVSAGGGVAASASLFGRSDMITFFPL